jgi:drug/metabolite transporter (DMT)-like permease
METKNNAVLYLIITAIIWSSGGVMIKWVEWNPMAVAGLRSLLAAVVMAIAFRGERISFSRPQWAGAVAYCATMILFVMATKLTTAANAILLQYTAPIYVALLGQWLLGEKVTRHDWLTVMLVFGGMFFFFLDKVTSGSVLGNCLAIVSGVCFALFIIFMRMQKNAAPYGTVLLGNLLTFLISLPFLSNITMNFVNVGAILYLGLFQLGFAYVLYSQAIRQVNALKTILITSIEPILNPIWVFLLLGETPGRFALIGGLIVVSSIIMHSRTNITPS